MRNYGKYGEELRAKSHCVFLMFYHLVLVTKYRKCFFEVPTARRLFLEEVMKSAHECEITVKDMAIESDHVHLLLEATPQSKITDFIRLAKGRSSFRIRKAIPEFAKHKAFWSPSFCLLTTGGAPIDIIRKYIEKQGIRDKKKAG